MNKKLKKEIKELKRSNNMLFGATVGAVVAAAVNTFCLIRSKKQIAQNTADIEALVGAECEDNE